MYVYECNIYTHLESLLHIQNVFINLVIIKLQFCFFQLYMQILLSYFFKCGIKNSEILIMNADIHIIK